MRSQSIIILAIAVVIGLAAVFLANSYLGRVEQTQAQTAQGTRKVAVARVPIDFGAQITPDKVKLIDWPAESIPAGAFHSIEQLLPMGKARVALRPMLTDEPILRPKLAGEGGRATISAVLKPGMRAAAVRVNDVAGVAGFVLPGDVVDVLVTRSPADMSGGGGQITDVLLQKVRVIAIDQDANDNTDKPVIGKTATLEVTQLDSQKLALAQQVGTLSLVLGTVAGDTNPSVETVSVEDLRDGAFVGGYSAPRPVAFRPSGPASPPPPRAAAPRQRAAAPLGSEIQVVRGTENKSYEVGRYAGF
ncbi:Flp pilus assembly protein CpaB [Sphingomonas sp. MG17]|uniref:Flp pilus assembly protein CpaB n=1 Tax=Sphingomonas tagetis TaxID=2949092 RepID=A0A9X2KKF0_9SPHN|nr:Flp pilus assembly protein CpaB [Sphingomonas tagetis]MCP3729537.1 Flp pilus assembly protein CpaB [Sphingomonas tagetis]